MSERRQLDPMTVALSSTNLVEASAGTGKTYALCILFVRLLLEKGLPVERILVVTYTRAATQELKERVLERLHRVRDALLGGFPADREEKDPFPQAMAARDDGTFTTRIERALRDFDEASIFTIHGFCQRILSDNAFLAGVDFDLDMAGDSGDFLAETARDFWRREFAGAHALVLAHARHRKRSPDSYRHLLRLAQSHAGAEVRPGGERPDLSVLEGYEASRLVVADMWPGARHRVRALLVEHEGLHKTLYGNPDKEAESGVGTAREEKVDGLCAEMDAWAADGPPGYPLFGNFERFTRDYLAGKGTNKGYEPPEHGFFHACQQLKDIADEVAGTLDAHMLYLDNAFLEWAGPRLEKKKDAAGVRFYDDLVESLKNALAGPRGKELAHAVSGDFGAALIDEFQDTDPDQLAVFTALFAAPDKPLFWIGDPKQAIYGFRGADLFAYLQAAESAAHNHTLAVNWRSSPGLVHAVNTLFGRHEAPFVLPGIEFEEIAPAPRDGEPFSAGPGGRLRLWHLSGPEKSLGKPEARGLVERAVVAEIATLLRMGSRGEARVGDRGLVEGDIAVLVRTNAQASSIQEGLRRHGINAVLQSRESLFASTEARDLLLVLSAMADPGNGTTVRSALATATMGHDGAAIHALAEDDEGWETVLRRFHHCRDLWRDRGFIRTFHWFMRETGLRADILSRPGGERSLTNVLHLAEVLHRAEREEHLGTRGLIRWLARRVDSLVEDEEYQLRMESDARAVQVVTVHRSKGLEYPVVLCPYLWEGGPGGGKGFPDYFVYHDPQRGNRPVLDLGSEDAQASARRGIEDLAERMRIMYVALTRARHLCYMAWGKVNQGWLSAPSYLLLPRRGDAGPRAVGPEEWKRLSHEDLRVTLEQLAEKSGHITLEPLPGSAPEVKADEGRSPALECRTFTGVIDRTWRLASFTFLATQPDRHQEHERLAPDPPPIRQEAAPSSSGDGRDIHSFPAGAAAGIMLHSLFEELDFTSPDVAYRETLVREKLAEAGHDANKWTPAVLGMVDNVLACRLSEDDTELRLDNVSRADRMDEMEFCFPLSRTTPDRLRTLFQNHGAVLERPGAGIGFAPVRGFVRGFVDLVFRHSGRFYVVDYKSNRLGAAVEDYNREALAASMYEHHYVLQYHLYVLALHLHMRARMPDYDYERDFGGVRYLFLRGMSAESGAEFGVFSDRPSPGLIEELAVELARVPDRRVA